MTTLLSFPEAASIPIVYVNGKRLYRTPNGDYPGVTTINRTIGTGSEGLISWAAALEREAVLEAAKEAFSDRELVLGKPSPGVPFQFGASPVGFIKAVERLLGPARQHQKQLQKAGDLGSSIHRAIHHYLSGQEIGPLAPDAMTGFNAWLVWWSGSGFQVVKTEQRIFDDEHRYAGTADIIAVDRQGVAGIIDIKSSKGVYDEHHIQVAAYLHAARNFHPDMVWGKIVRVPKTVGDTKIDVVELGDLYEGRKRTEDQLFEAFLAARTLYRVLVETE